MRDLQEVMSKGNGGRTYGGLRIELERSVLTYCRMNCDLFEQVLCIVNF